MKNHFELLGLKITFEIDEALLKQQYLSLQQQFHPDKFSLPHEKQKAAVLAARINEAYETLNCRLKRACYLLSLLNIELDSHHAQCDGDFLMQQMALREQLAAIKAEKSELKVFLQKMQDACESRFSMLATSFTALPESQTALINQIHELFFFNKLKTEAEQYLWQS